MTASSMATPSAALPISTAVSAPIITGNGAKYPRQMSQTSSGEGRGGVLSGVPLGAWPSSQGK